MWIILCHCDKHTIICNRWWNSTEQQICNFLRTTVVKPRFLSTILMTPQYPNGISASISASASIKSRLILLHLVPFFHFLWRSKVRFYAHAILNIRRKLLFLFFKFLLLFETEKNKLWIEWKEREINTSGDVEEEGLPGGGHLLISFNRNKTVCPL